MIADAKKEGRMNEIKETARNLKNSGIDLKSIFEAAGLLLEEIEKS